VALHISKKSPEGKFGTHTENKPEHDPLKNEGEIMPTKSNDRNWTTENEKEWLNNIGQHNKNRRNNLTVSHALQFYLEASKKRVNWASIDREEAVAYAESLLARELDVTVAKCR